MNEKLREKSIKAYDLRPVYVNDEPISARPVQWDGKDYAGDGRDQDGRQLNTTVYITTCPKCANMIQFYAEEIFVDDGKDKVSCPHCHAGEQEIKLAKEINVKSILSKAYDTPIPASDLGPDPDSDLAPEPDWPEPVEMIPDPEGFVDPIGKGLMKLE